MKSSVILLTILIIALDGCSNPNDNLIEKMKKVCPGQNNCLIDMKNLTGFDWDSMYVIKEGNSLEEIDQIIGFEYPYFTDLARRVIFVKLNKVVYHEDEFSNPSEKKKEQLIFKYPNEDFQFMVFPKDNATFFLKKIQTKDSKYYILQKSDIMKK